MTRSIIAAIVLSASALANGPLKAADLEPNSEARVLNLPETPFNYADTQLPEYSSSWLIRRADNTSAENPITDHGATLGRVLFYDTKLSANNKTACASCHLQEHAFAEQKRVSVGFEGKRVDRNAMSLVNARYYPNGRFFWDERAGTLEDQVLMPIESPAEMGRNLHELVVELSSDPIYPRLFQLAFGDGNVTQDRLAKALAQFVRSMVSFRSPYDRGANQAESVFDDFSNFTELENQGKRIFFGEQSRANCASCHMLGPPGRVGQQRAIFQMVTATNNGLDDNLFVHDGGVADITFRGFQIGNFKSPSLRNVEVTGPYMHDGRFATLEEVIDHYDNGIKPHPNLDPRLRGRGGRPRRLNLTHEQKTALVAFLKTLTDEAFLTDKRFSNPFVETTTPPMIDLSVRK